MSQHLQTAMDPFHAIADPNRRRLLDLLRNGERCVSELVPHLGITTGAVSQHLRILHRSGLVRWRKDGRFRFYRAEAAPLGEVYEWLERYKTHWEASLDRLGDYLERQS